VGRLVLASDHHVYPQVQRLNVFRRVQFCVSFAAVPGTAILGPSGRPPATGTAPTSGSTSTASVSGGRLPLRSYFFTSWVRGYCDQTTGTRSDLIERVRSWRFSVHTCPHGEIIGGLSAAVEHNNQRALPAKFAAWDIDLIVPRTSRAGEASVIQRQFDFSEGRLKVLSARELDADRRDKLLIHQYARGHAWALIHSQGDDAVGHILATPLLGGLHHHYVRI
jgi:hypothetical protein